MKSLNATSKSMIAVAVAAVFAASHGWAQTTKVDANNINQSQVGLLNSQEMDLGNAKGKGSSTNVNVKGVNQSQAGLLNKQKMSVGSGNQGKTKVTASNINQSQAGLLNSQ